MNDKGKSLEDLTKKIRELKEHISLLEEDKSRTGHLKFLENLNHIDSVIRKSTDLEQMTSEVLQTVLEIFNSDRAWLVTPCDPNADTCSVFMERSKAKYPGAFALGEPIKVTPKLQLIFRKALDSFDAITIDSQDKDAPRETDLKFSVKSQIEIAMHPRTGGPWLLGLHQCSHLREWTNEEQELFREISHRLSDALGTLLVMKELKSNEEKFKCLSDASSEAIFFSKRGICLGANQTAAEMFGWDHPDDFTGIFGTDVIAEQSRELVKSNMLNNRLGMYEALGVRKDGTEFPITVRARNIPYGSEGIVRTTLVQDISEQKRIEAVLINEQKTAQTYLNLAGVMFVAIDSSGLITLVNRKTCDILGWKENELIGKNWFDHCLPQSLKKTIKEVSKQILLDHPEPVEYFENPVVTKDGSERLIAWHNTVFRNESGEITGHLSSGVDITLRREAENALHSQHEQLLSILNGMEEVIYVADPKTHELIYMNSIAIENWGEGVGHKCYEVLQNLDSPCHFCPGDTLNDKDLGRTSVWESENKINGKHYRNIDKVIRWTDGRLVKFELSVDITDLKKAARTQLDLERQIQHAQKLESLGILAGGIAHDFNNILMAILGNADLAMMTLSETNPSYSNIKAIETAAKRAADLSRQMLAYSGKGQFQIELINLREEVEEMTHMIEVSISKKAVLKYNYADNLPLIEADATQIRQIIMNLVTNASDAIDKTSGLISITVGVKDCDKDYLASTYIDEPSESKQYVFLEVRDTGSGMNKETLEKLFDPFFTTKFTGRGLGLSAVLGIIKGHKGAIKVESEPGKGTTIEVLLPASTNSFIRDKSKDNSEHWSCSGTVLLVDDEESVLSVGKQMLQMMGFEVLCATNGREAVSIFRKNPDDIAFVLLDLIMPHLDGEETYRELKLIDKNVCVIMCSGYNEQEVTQRFSVNSPAGFIQKPYMFKELEAEIKKVIEGFPNIDPKS